MWFRTHSLRRKLSVLFLLIGLVPVTITALITSDIANTHLRQQTFSLLDAVRQIKSSAVSRYMKGVQQQIITMAESSMVISAMDDFNRTVNDYALAASAQQSQPSNTPPDALRNYYEQAYADRYMSSTGFKPDSDSLLSHLTPITAELQSQYISRNIHPIGSKHLLDRAPGDEIYHTVHAQVHSDFRNYTERFNYYDIFLVDTSTGTIVYSVRKELDFATSLESGPFSSSNAGSAYKEAKLLAKGEVSLHDYAPYSPSYEEPASFIATPIFKGDTRIGVLMFQIPLEPINEIMNERAGMGITGESYLLGQDRLMRSDSFLSPINFSVLSSFNNPGSHQIDSLASAQALNGITGNEHATDYLGNTVLASYGLVDLGPFEWAIVAKINAEEALASAHLMSKVVLFLVVLSTAAVILLAFMLTRYLTRPLNELSDASTAVADGERNIMITPAKDVELSRLTNAFNHMLKTRQEHEQKLEQALKEAKQAARSKNDFLASMSHEIRTPMNGVLGMLGLVQSSPLNSTQRHRIEVAEGSARSLLNLINDILDFSKVDAGKLELETLDFSPRQLIGDVAEAMACQAQNKHLELILDMQQIDASMVKGDPARIRQVLTNLISNAIKFTDAGEILVRAELHEEEKSHDGNPPRWLLQCKISDTGIGIPSAKIKYLFDAFSQVDTSTTRHYGGTGLGLAIVKRLCNLMGGSISVTSNEGQGSCFSVSIELEKSTRSQRVVPSVDLSKLSILIVDDNQTNREVLHGQLTYWGASVHETASGKEALDICRQRANKNELFDIAILDMQMPSMDGAELGKHLKADDAFSSMKLVMMTSMGHSEDSQYFKSLGFDAYFPKPVTTADIFNALSLISEENEALPAEGGIVTSGYLQTLHPNSQSIHQRHYDKFAHKRILLVEDNQVNQLVALGLLEQLSIKADIAANGHEAINALSQAPEDAPYHLVLMDCQMPEMDGYEATRQIRSGHAGERNRDIRIVALTANAMAGDREKCIKAGMNDYLSKPLESNSLKAKLTVWLAPD